MDIRILLILQEFRNGGGALLAEFAAKMTFLGELNSAMVIMAVIYWCVSRDFGTFLLMGWIPGPAGTVSSCFLQMFHIVFLFPFFLKMAGREGPDPAGRA